MARTRFVWLLLALLPLRGYRIWAAEVAAATEVPDLGTRRQGHDWPAFLGPTGDSESRAAGILTQWPREGPRLVWQQRLGTGYGMPAISRGRLYQFARFGDQARLSAARARPANPSGSSSTDRLRRPVRLRQRAALSPVVDGDRV